MDGLTVQNHGNLLAMASRENVIEECGFAGSKVSCEISVSRDSLYDLSPGASLNHIPGTPR